MKISSTKIILSAGPSCATAEGVSSHEKFVHMRLRFVRVKIKNILHPSFTMLRCHPTESRNYWLKEATEAHAITQHLLPSKVDKLGQRSHFLGHVCSEIFPSIISRLNYTSTIISRLQRASENNMHLLY